MNTLSRVITAHLFTSPDEYAALKAHWSLLVNSERKHDLGPEHHLLYLMLMGKDWRHAFAPITNRRKLDNGGFEAWGLKQAYSQVTSRYRQSHVLAPFDELVTPDMLATLQGYLPTIRFSKEDCATGYKGDAYIAPCEEKGRA